MPEAVSAIVTGPKSDSASAGQRYASFGCLLQRAISTAGAPANFPEGVGVVASPVSKVCVSLVLELLVLKSTTAAIMITIATIATIILLFIFYNPILYFIHEQLFYTELLSEHQRRYRYIIRYSMGSLLHGIKSRV